MIQVIIFKLQELLRKRGYADDRGEILYRAAARDIGVSHSSLWKLCNQDKLKKPYNPSLATLDILCKKLKCGKLGALVEFKKGK